MNISCPHCKKIFTYQRDGKTANDILIACPSCSKDFQVSSSSSLLPKSYSQNTICPYCRKETPPEAIRCRFCGKFKKNAKIIVNKLRDDDAKTNLVEALKNRTEFPRSYWNDYFDKIPSSFQIDYPTALQVEIALRNKGVGLKIEEGDTPPPESIKRPPSTEPETASFETIYPKISIDKVLKAMGEKHSLFYEMIGRLFTQRKDLIIIGLIVIIPFFSLRLNENLQILFFPIFLGILWAFIILSFFGDSNIPLSYAFKCFLFTSTISIILVFMMSEITQIFHFLPDVIYLIVNVGFVEELCKILPILFLLRKANKTSLTFRYKDIFVLSMICGIGFGSFENILYKIRIDYGIRVASIYKAELVAGMSNAHLFRLISLPFLHAVWSGIIGVICFHGFVMGNMKKYIIVGLLIIGSIHGWYDFFSSKIIRISIVSASIVFAYATFSFTRYIDKMKAVEMRSSVL